MPLQQLATESALGIAFARVENRENESKQEENSGEPAGDLREDVGGLRAENILRYAAAKGRAQAFAFRALHQNHEHHQRRDEDVQAEKNVDQKGHRDGQYRQEARFVNAGLSSRAPQTASDLTGSLG